MNKLTDLVRWLANAPAGTQVSAAAIHQALTDIVPAAARPEPVELSPAVTEPTWRERLWTCPPETRMTVNDLSEAIGKSSSWIYKRTMPKAKERIPCRRLAGDLVFVAGEIRTWLEESEAIIEPGSRFPHLRAG